MVDSYYSYNNNNSLQTTNLKMQNVPNDTSGAPTTAPALVQRSSTADKHAVANRTTQSGEDVAMPPPPPPRTSSIPLFVTVVANSAAAFPNPAAKFIVVAERWRCRPEIGGLVVESTHDGIGPAGEVSRLRRAAEPKLKGIGRLPHPAQIRDDNVAVWNVSIPNRCDCETAGTSHFISADRSYDGPGPGEVGVCCSVPREKINAKGHACLLMKCIREKRDTK